MLLLTLALAVSGGSASTAVAPPDPCGLVTQPEAAAVIGAGVAKLMSEGPAPDEETGAQRSVCIYRNAQIMLVIMVLEFPTADAARETLTRETVSAQLEDESATVEQESGIGDRAYWGTTDHSVAYVVLRGSRVLGIVLGGDGLGEPAQRRAGLRKAAVTATGRL
jgi:hypothetical protein